MKKILVVGGAGYIGGPTTDLLVDKGFKVTVYDRLLYESRFLKDINFVNGDVREADKLMKLSKKFDEIIWLAAIVGDGACQQNPELTTEINLNSIKFFLYKTKRRIIFASTCSVYGAQDKLLTERSKTTPLSLYALTKLEAEKHVLNNDGLVFRLGTLFGLGDKFSRIRLDLVVNVLTLKAMRDKKLTVYGGEQWRPIIAVKDVAEYFAEAVESKKTGVYNIKKRNVTIINLAKMIKKVFPKVKIKTTKMPFEDLRNYRVGSSKAEKDFKFKPKTTVVDEVKRMKKMFNDKRIKNLDDPVYYNIHYVKLLLDNKEF